LTANSRNYKILQEKLTNQPPQWENNQMKRSMFAAIASDVHLWVPVCVLLGGICLLVVLR